MGLTFVVQNNLRLRCLQIDKEKEFAVDRGFRFDMKTGRTRLLYLL